MKGLSLRRLKPDTSTAVVYKPFSESDDFNDWWDDAIFGFEPNQHFYAFFVGQQEVARVEIEIQDILDVEYNNPSRPGPYAVIGFFEVSVGHRRKGYGTEAVRLLADRYAGAPLAAFSERADQFWGSLGWARYEHTTEPEDHRPLFLGDPGS